MTGPELIGLAARRNVNPYYLAYALATGAQSVAEAFERDGGNHEFMAWNSERWAEQCKAEGIGREWISAIRGAFNRHCALCATFVPERATDALSSD